MDKPTGAAKFLKVTSLIWYFAILIGQGAFFYFIVAYYGRKTVQGDYAGWNEKPIIDGYIPGDNMGNIAFITHVLIGGLMTFGGLFQLIPAIRKYVPWVHRYIGRLFMVAAFTATITGFALTFARGTRLSDISAYGVALDGVLILVFATMAWRYGIRREIDHHHRWALRTFIVANGVWLLRISIMCWAILTGGWGMDGNLGGPADSVIVFANYLLPLAALELYFRAQRSESSALKIFAGIVVLLLTALMAVGIFGTIGFMWGPYL